MAKAKIQIDNLKGAMNGLQTSIFEVALSGGVVSGKFKIAAEDGEERTVRIMIWRDDNSPQEVLARVKEILCS